MDRSKKGHVDPNHRAPAPDERDGPRRDDAWASALRALRDAARQREQDGAALRQLQPGSVPSAPRGPSRQDAPLPQAPSNDAPRKVALRTEGAPPDDILQDAHGPAVSEPAASEQISTEQGVPGDAARESPPPEQPSPGFVRVPAPQPAAPPAAPSALAPGPSPDLDETLRALHALARRYAAPAAPPAPTHAAVFPSERPVGPAYGGHEAAPPDEFAEPAPGARLLTRRARWASFALILVSAAVLAVLLVGGLSLSRQLFQASDTRGERVPVAAQDLSPRAPADSAAGISAPAPSNVVTVASHAADGAADLPAIEKAMSDCDDEAAKNRDALYFLVVPAVSPLKDYAHWTPLSVGDIGTSVILLRSKDALDGLRDGSLAVYSGSYKFSIVDSTSEAAHDWGPVTGVAKLIKLDAADISGFRVRFSFADFDGSTPSNFRFPREKGVCYWVSALLRS